MYLHKSRFGIYRKHLNQLDLILITMLIGPVAISIADRTPYLFLTDVALVSLVLIWMMKSSLKSTHSLYVPKVFRWILLYIAVIIGTLPMAVDMLRSLAIAKLYIMPSILFVLAYNVLRTENDVRHLVVGLAMVGLVLAGMALFNWEQFYTGSRLLQEEYGAKDMVQTVTGRSNTVAGISALLSAPALFLLFEKRLGLKLLGIITLVMLTTSILFAMSRGAIIAFGAGMLVWLILLKPFNLGLKRLWRIILVLILIAIFISFEWHVFPDQFKNLFLTGFGHDIDHFATRPRMIRWIGILEHFKEAPVFGIGVGNYIPIMDQLNLPMGGSAHNLYLETLNETGIVGFITLFGFLIGFGRNLYRLRKMVITDKQLMLTNCLIMVYVIFLADVFVESNYYSVVFTYIFWMLMAMGFVMNRIISQNFANLQKTLKENLSV